MSVKEEVKSVKKICENHQRKKMLVVSGIIGAGMISAVCLSLCSRMNGRLTEGNRLFRNEWGAGDYSVTLQAENTSNGWKEQIRLEIEERKLTEKEKEYAFQNIANRLPDLIKGNNRDLYHVEEELNLLSAIKEYPMTIIWKSNSKRIRESGEVDRSGLEEGEWTEIIADVKYGQEQRTFEFPVYLMPEIPDEKTVFFRELEEKLLQTKGESGEEKEVVLPEEIEGQNIRWQEIREDNTPYILCVSVIGAIAAAAGMDQELEKNRKKKKQRFSYEYPNFISMLRLYLSAGMTTQRAFCRLALDYKKRSDDRGKELAKELQIACNRFKNGVPEETVYREWGERCMEMRYRKLSLLLITHLKIGNGQLLKFLDSEEISAREEKRQMARKLGEEASVKLLFPMLLQLLVVMFLILIPAYIDFGGI